ncbi:MAG: histidine phosphotransferase [Desulfovibrio sp.]|nr:histidine phosphotransferase [Desulfovibrio sp.]HBU36617.1 Hpt domain-containing protein [Planctomycetaceae bacterium]|tara:strand:- start:487 stop:795 length:309 start_codon:yes stop_codon:yes gene_type:complete
MSEAVVEQIDSSLAELMDRFFSNFAKDLVKMQVVLETRDYDNLSRLGHTVKGTGYGYGFRGLGDLGSKLEKAAKDADQKSCQQLINKIEWYLANVHVEFVNE